MITFDPSRKRYPDGTPPCAGTGPIRVSAISPSIVNLGGCDAAAASRARRTTSPVMAGRNPARGIGTAADGANGVLFAITSTCLTGQKLHIDGGGPLA